MERTTLSPSWNRVARLKPVLSQRVEIRRQLFRGEPWYVVHDPITNDFFRLNPVLYHLVGLFDGQRSVDDLWRLTLERFADDAPTQNEIIGVLSQLYSSNLLHVDKTADVEALLTRQRQRRLRHWRGQAMSILFMRIPIFNPDRILSWLLPIFRPLLNKWGMLIWLAWVTFVLWQFLPYLRQFVGDADGVLKPSNWPWMIVLFLATKAVHELGHGLVCKRFGGVVPEIGIMFLVLFPVPYVNATSSWGFTSRWHRMLVAAAGMIFEITIAAAAAMIWLNASENSLARQLSYNLVFLASVTTLIFNGNPLLRFDGYYILADLLGIANLYERGGKQIQWIVQRYAFGLHAIPPIAVAHGEKVWLTLYGFASTAYRFMVLFGIFLFIIGQLYVVGVLLALWSLMAWLVVPIGRFIRWLAVSPTLIRHRARAIAVTAGAVAILVTLVGLVPIKDHRRVNGVVQSANTADIVMPVNGFVTEVLAGPNQNVRSGDVILVAENAQLNTEYEIRQKQSQALERELDAAIGKGIGEVREVKRKIANHNKKLNYLKQRIDDLTIRSPRDGIIVGAELRQLKGRYFKRGQVVATVVDPQQVRVTALVGQSQNAPLFNGQQIEKVQLRTAGNPGQVLDSTVRRIFDAADKQLPHPGLGYPGGGPIATDPADPNGRTMLRPHFELWLDLPEPDSERESLALKALPGHRVYIRFTLKQRTALLYQWVHRLNRVIRARISV